MVALEVADRAYFERQMLFIEESTFMMRGERSW